MRRFALLSFSIAALVLCGAAFSPDLSAGSKPGGQDARQGTVTSIEKTPDGIRIATVRLSQDAGARPDVKVYGAESMSVKPGMRVRLDVMLGTAVFSMPVGTVVEVPLDGKSCLFSIDESLLDAAMEDPTSRQTCRVKDYLKVGAAVSISR